MSVTTASASNIRGVKARTLRPIPAWTTTGSPTVTVATYSGTTYDVYTYTSTGTGTLVSTGSRSVCAPVLVVAGGGGGGSYGGSGGLVWKLVMPRANAAVTASRAAHTVCRLPPGSHRGLRKAATPAAPDESWGWRTPGGSPSGTGADTAGPLLNATRKAARPSRVLARPRCPDWRDAPPSASPARSSGTRWWPAPRRSARPRPRRW